MAEEVKRDMPVAEALDILVGRNSNTKLPVFCNKVALTAEASPANGGLFSWQNPFSVKVIATVILNVRTPATGAANANVGRGSAAATDNDNLLDGIDIGTAAIVGNASDHNGTNGLFVREIDENGGTNDFITGTASADSSGIVGEALILFIPES